MDVALAGLGGHLLLAIGTALTGVAPLAAVGGGAPDQAAAVAALAALSAAAWAAARLLPRGAELRLVLDALALAAFGLLSAAALEDTALTLALAGEAIALAALARRERAGGGGDRCRSPPRSRSSAPRSRTPAERSPHPAALIPAPRSRSPSRSAAAASRRPARSSAARRRTPACGWRSRPARRCSSLYVASVLLVAPFQPGAGTAGLPLAELGVRQQGQALLSSLWALAGVAALVAACCATRARCGSARWRCSTVTVGEGLRLRPRGARRRSTASAPASRSACCCSPARRVAAIRPRALPDLRGVPGRAVGLQPTCTPSVRGLERCRGRLHSRRRRPGRWISVIWPAAG